MDDEWHATLHGWTIDGAFMLVEERIEKSMEELRESFPAEVPQNEVWQKVQRVDWRRYRLEEVDVEEDDEKCCPFCSKKLVLFPNREAHIVLCSGILHADDGDG